MWAGLVKRLSRFFVFDGVSRGVRASGAAEREGGGKRKHSRRRQGRKSKKNLKRISKSG